MTPYSTFETLAETKIEKLLPWYLETPMVITKCRFEELQKVQQLLYKAINFYVTNYELFDHIFSIDANIQRIVRLCKPYKYRVGTYRPDLLIKDDGQLKICEIGARFPLNGYFYSGIAAYIGEHYLGCTVDQKTKKQYEHFIDYLFQYFGDFNSFCILKGEDKAGDFLFYVPYFEELGFNVNILSPSEIESNLHLLDGAAVINEFSQIELSKLSDKALTIIAASNGLNDMRSIFLIHDKRFLAVLSDIDFLTQAIGKDDMEFLSNYLIPTYTRDCNSEVWKVAMANKNQWIVKHYLLGKSEHVYAGCVMEEHEWESIFASNEIERMILQPFISQKRFKSHIGSISFNDYAVGTLLCFDNKFFGPGIFRCSSYEITNKVDDRKISPWFTNTTSRTKTFIL